MIFGADPALREIVLLSLQVSGIALLISTLIGVPLGVFMALRRFWGRKVAISFLYTGMGFPPVVIGLFVYLMLSRNGPLGSLGWSWIPALFTPAAMVIAQTIIAFPGRRLHHGRRPGGRPESASASAVPGRDLVADHVGDSQRGAWA
ncbi:MAG: ABC transporter permease [Caldilineaceae bacterium]